MRSCSRSSRCCQNSNRLGVKSVATPVRWSRNVTTRGTLVERAHTFVEFLSTRDHVTLSTRVRAELTAARASREVRVGFARRSSCRPHPRCESGDRVTRSTRESTAKGLTASSPTLSRFVVREPTDGVIVDVTKQHHPRTRPSLERRRRDRNRVALGHLVLRLVEPSSELHERIRVAVRDLQRPPPFAHRTSANCQFGGAERSKELGPS